MNHDTWRKENYWKNPCQLVDVLAYAVDPFHNHQQSREMITCYPAKVILVLNDEFCVYSPKVLAQSVPFLGTKWGDAVYHAFSHIESQDKDSKW